MDTDQYMQQMQQVSSFGKEPGDAAELGAQRRLSILTKNQGQRGIEGAGEIEDESLNSLPTPTKHSSSMDRRDQGGNSTLQRQKFVQGCLPPKSRREASLDPGKSPSTMKASQPLSLLQQSRNNHSISLLPQISPNTRQRELNQV